MKAYLIARVSTEDQEDALPAQVYRLEDYAKHNNFSALLFRLQESAFKDGRKEFGKIVAQIQAEQEKVVVVFDKIDRYSRDNGSIEVTALRNLCKVGRIEIHFPSDMLTVTNTSPAQVWFMLGMGEASAEYYSRSTSDNVKRRFEQMLRDGKIIGQAPFGYKNIQRENGEKWVEIDAYNAEIVRRIYKEYATGVSSLKLIHKKIKADYGVVLSTSQLDLILKNPFYKGEMLYKGVLYPHKYERIIASKLYEKAKAVREGYNIKPAIYAGLPYPYRGLISCAECGCRVTFEKKKGQYVYGHCTQTRGKHSASYVPQENFTKQFKEIIRGLAISDEVYREVSARLRESVKADEQARDKQLALIDAEIKKYDLRLERMLDEHLDKKIPDAPYEKKLAEFTKAQEVLQKRRNKFELVSKYDFTTVDHLLKLAKNAPQLFEKGRIERKRSLLKMIHSNLELAGSELRWKLKKPFSTMALCNITGNWLPTIEEVITVIKKDLVGAQYI